MRVINEGQIVQFCLFKSTCSLVLYIYLTLPDKLATALNFKKMYREYNFLETYLVSEYSIVTAQLFVFGIFFIPKLQNCAENYDFEMIFHKKKKVRHFAKYSHEKLNLA